MRLHSKLCHFQEGIAIVSVNASIDNNDVGSCLGQGETVEIAEDKAILRLMNRLNNNSKEKYSLTSNSSSKRKEDSINTNQNRDNHQIIEDLPNKLTDNNNSKKLVKNIEVNLIPNDWSKELAEVDIEIKRLKWDRNDESKFLNELFGYSNRTKITNYNELSLMIRTLRKLNVNNDGEFILTRKILISLSDDLLDELSWDASLGRSFIKKQFNVLSRSELSDTQLKAFNNHLLEQCNKKRSSHNRSKN